MAAEFDTQPNYRGEDDPPPPARTTRRDDRGVWGILALVVFAAIVLVVVLTQLTAKVPSLVGLPRDTAEAKLAKAGFSVGDVSEIPTESAEAGKVCEQTPAPGETMRRGSTVDLMVAQSDNLKTVPDVRGHDSASASVELMQAGFEIANAEEFNSSVPIGAAVSQSPPGGTQAPDGSTVSVTYSLGAQTDANPAVLRTDTNPELPATSGGRSLASTQLALNLSRAYPSAIVWSEGGDIYARLAPGQATRRLTATGDWDTQPIISPSRKFVVFLRAHGQGEPATSVCAISLTTMRVIELSMPETTRWGAHTPTYGAPVFAPNPGSATPDSDWMVLPQYWTERYLTDTFDTSARLVVCNVPINSSWVSWNIQFRPAHTISLINSDRAGCVRVRQTEGDQTLYDREFELGTGLYLR